MDLLTPRKIRRIGGGEGSGSIVVLVHPTRRWNLMVVMS
jgi:hypothetical protein